MRYPLRSFAIILAWLFLPLAALAQTDAEKLTRILADRLPGASPDQVAPSPINGVFEVLIGGQVLYVTADGRYALAGKLIDLDSGQNLTERVMSKGRLTALAKIPEDTMIIYEPKGEVKHTLTTFTDIDCPYCRKMHKEIDVLTGNGVRVRYLLFPRAGVNSVSYEKAVSVWCAKDPQAELTLAKTGQMPERRDCSNPVQKHLDWGRRLGLTGTPFSIMDTGQTIGGYVPALDLITRLDAAKGID